VSNHTDLIQTGILGLDSVLRGGFPRGNVVLLSGGVGTGKTTLGVEFVYRGAAEFDEPGVIVLFELSPDRLIRDAAKFGWDLPALEAAGKLKIIFTNREVFGQEVTQADSLLTEEVTKIGARRIFVDGVAGVARGPQRATGREARDAFFALADTLSRQHLTAVLAMEARASRHGRSRASAEESVADTLIRLRMEDVTRATVRSIQIVKSRGHGYEMGRHTFGIVAGRGVEVYRRVQSPRRVDRDRAAAFDLTTRVTTGVPGLDPLVNGGYFLGSTTVVAGISGAGKSVMGLQFLAEGARRGERSLMLTLDEQVPQVLRNARTIGIDLESLCASGLVRIQYDAPQEMEVDRHFHDLGSSGRMFRDFFHALVALMKEHQTATVYNHENPDLLGMASMLGEFAMSSLVDNILLMNWIELGDAFRLGLTVAKMRANPNPRLTHECEIINGEGMRVLPRTFRPSDTLPFSSYRNLVSTNPARGRAMNASE
jgi:circadian clock protein KaiC